MLGDLHRSEVCGWAERTGARAEKKSLGLDSPEAPSRPVTPYIEDVGWGL